jgi:hypothetical protein
MEKRVCSYCGKETLVNDRFCGYCGGMIIPPLRNAPQKVPAWAVIIILFAIVAGISYLGSCSPASKEDPMKEDNSIMAWAMSHEFVNQRIKAPSTADYSSFENSKVYNEGNQKYTVDAYVDSQNSFGAKLRTYYRCQLDYIVSTEKWHLRNFQFLDSMP